MPNMLDDGLDWLKGMLAEHAGALDDAADVILQSYEADAYGEQVATETVVSPAVPCQVAEMTGEQIAEQGRDASKRMARLRFFDERPFPPDDATRYRLRVGDRVYAPVDLVDVGSRRRQWVATCELVTG